MLKDLENRIVTILSHERSENSMQPLAIGKRKLGNLMLRNKPPNLASDVFQEELEKALESLWSAGEILSGSRYYCVAPPTLITNSKEECINGLKFLGDRAYLQLVHKELRSKIGAKPTLIHPRISKFDRIQEKLHPWGIRVVTTADRLQVLSRPRKPSSHLLQCPIDLPDLFSVDMMFYRSAPHTPQGNRWHSTVENRPTEPTILRKAKKNRSLQAEYFWWDGSRAYSLETEVAVLAMFSQDQEKHAPVIVAWDDYMGILKLQDVFLPYSYMQYIWQLSEDGDEYRTRRIPSTGSRQLIKSALEQLGCQLQ
jgi:hypothetical protein